MDFGVSKDRVVHVENLFLKLIARSAAFRTQSGREIRAPDLALVATACAHARMSALVSSYFVLDLGDVLGFFVEVLA